MKHLFLGVLLAACVQSFSAMPAHAAEGGPVPERVDAKTRSEVIAAIDAWRAAVVEKDRNGLERAYHADLSYGHTDGAVLSRQEQIDRTLVPDRDFTAVDAQGIAVRAYGDVAYVTATYTFHVKPKDEDVRLARLSGLDVWTRTEHGWQLIARQLTRPAQPTP